MANYLDKFPLVRYTLDKKLLNEYDTVTNILFRLVIIKDIIETNVDSYYVYAITDSDTPEILAEKIYGNAEAHWIILYANNIYDPYFDWPMNEKAFEKYIIKKYGSVELAKTTYHHYEKVIKRENPAAQVTTTTTFEVNDKKLTDGVLTLGNYSTNFVPNEIVFVGPSNATNTFSGNVVSWSNVNGQIILANTNGKVAPAQYLIGLTSAANGTVVRIDQPSVPMDAYNTLIDTTDFATYNIAGQTVYETTSRARVSYYDYEERLNESKKQIKIIHPRYYSQIISEFDNITGRTPFFKRP